MGLAKQLMMEQDEQGWSFTDHSVCPACVGDEALAAILREHLDPTNACDFCDATAAAPLDALLDAFVRGLHNEYEHAIHGVGWESREGGYQWNPKWDTWDLVGEFDTVLIGEGLLDAVRDAMHDTTWVDHNFVARRRDVVLTEAWDRFCSAVKYETRYVFWRRPGDDADPGVGEIAPAEILDEVGGLIDRLGLITVVPAGHRFWRAHTHDEPAIDRTASRLGTVPRDKALAANRMSPAGIPMFYGAGDATTAIREVAFHSDHANVTWAQFELTANLAVVDFTALPTIPSMFDPDLGAMRRQLSFLHHFVAQLSDRARPLHEQIDYVPTQIVTEYLLRVHGEGQSADGLLYGSSITGDVCVVADVPNDRCVESAGITALPSFALVPGTVSTRTLSPSDRS